MHLPTPTTILALLLGTLTLQILASPLPTFTDIERRWSAGESDATIHANHNPRSASPSWPLARSSEVSAESFDALTQRERRAASDESNSAHDSALRARLRAFATRLLRSKGETELIEERRRSEEGVAEPSRVLKRKVRYAFTS